MKVDASVSVINPRLVNLYNSSRPVLACPDPLRTTYSFPAIDRPTPDPP